MIKLSQKRTCNNCKALLQEQYLSRCELGYNFNKDYRPVEICPKPKTILELIECWKLYKI